jgi:hypothetical protein
MSTNTKLQTKKLKLVVQHMEFLHLNQSLPAGQLIRKFLVKNIVLPINADSEVIDTTIVGVNLLAHEPYPYPT